jgi:hypothetical protein
MEVCSKSLFAIVNLEKVSFKATHQFPCSRFYPLVVLKLSGGKQSRKITLPEINHKGQKDVLI